jgi:hypothetical protein
MAGLCALESAAFELRHAPHAPISILATTRRARAQGPE